VVAGAPPAIDLAAEKRLMDGLLALAGEGLLRSAHDVSEGGLAVTLAECCFVSEDLSADVSLEDHEPTEVALFGERGGRAVVSVARERLAPLRSIAAQYHLGAREVGRVTRGEFRIQYNGRAVVSAAADSLLGTWAGALERALETERAWT
jgi:phosphoribosylformylglycinamidine (FGAM) synthase-like enzyme